MARRPDPEARPKLLAAARKAFGERGVDGARVEDISREAGLSKGAFYLHFDDKEQVFSELVGQFFGVMGDLALQRLEAELALNARIGPMTDADWRDKSERYHAFAKFEQDHTVRSLSAMWRHRDVLRGILEHGGGARGEAIAQFIDLARQNVLMAVAAAMRAGALRSDLDPDLVGDLVVGMWLQMGRRMVRLQTKPDLEAWARTVDRFTSEGLAVQPPALNNTDPKVNDPKVSHARLA